MAKYLGGCEYFYNTFNISDCCCGSCHEDDELFGIPMIEYSIDLNGEHHWFSVCCRVDNELTRILGKDWDKKWQEQVKLTS
jgi:hypothetical protein